MANFCEEWECDNRMNFMFSAFPENRNVNPKHWDSKLQFWKRAIVKSCNSLDELCFDINNLKTRFSRKGVTPLGLSTVVKDMLNCGEIVRTSDFLDSVYDSWTEWTYGMAKTFMWWTVGKVWQNNELDGSFLILDSAQKKAIEVLSCHHQSVKYPSTDNIVPENVLKARLKASNVNLSGQQFEIVVCYLRRERSVTIHSLESGEKVYKFAVKNESKVAAISETDLNILRLKKAEATIQLQIKKLQNDVDKLHAIAVSSVKQGRRIKAKKILSRKRAICDALDKKESLLMNTQDMLRRVQDCHSDASVIEALKCGAQVLKTMSQESGLTIDNVEKIMGEVEDIMDETAEIDRSILEGSKSVAASSGVSENDMEDLTKKLEDLMNDDSIAASEIREDAKEDLVTKLPEVPKFSPREVNEEKRTALTS